MHSLSSCKSKTPLQLYTEGMIMLQHHNILSLDYFQPVQESVYGVDNIGLIADENDSDSVRVPEVEINPSCDNLQLLSQLVHPLSPSNNHRIDLYYSVLNFILLL